MFTAVSVMGYAPSNINYCPECGASFPSSTYRDGSMECADRGLVCYIVEGDGSHSDNGEERK
jgi:hypothetical protein